ncbi:MAG TPA: porin [Rhizomicrobium sp.]|nr:porin [Rhizomicrobium sp.]
MTGSAIPCLTLTRAFAALFLTIPALPAWADDGGIQPPSAQLGDWTASAGMSLSGAAYAAHQDGGENPKGVQAFAVVAPSIARTFSDGWEAGVRSSMLVYHDHLSGDNYGNDVFEKFYLYADTPYGRVEIGQQDGVGYSQSVAAPVVDGPPAINDANVTMFRDPSAGGNALIGIFNLRTGMFISANDAKISYISPRFGGVAFGVSYTPYQTKAFLPFTMTGHHVADRVNDMVEGVVNYSGQIGDWKLQAFTALGSGRDAARTMGHDDPWDWSVGGETDTALGDAKLSLGVAYRISNAYTFNMQQAASGARTSNVDLGATYAAGPWTVGFEYETGTADAAFGAPALKESGWNPSVGYAVTANLQMTLGWQALHFHRDAGVFYNGKSAVDANGAYLHANFQI